MIQPLPVPRHLIPLWLWLWVQSRIGELKEHVRLVGQLHRSGAQEGVQMLGVHWGACLIRRSGAVCDCSPIFEKMPQLSVFIRSMSSTSPTQMKAVNSSSYPGAEGPT